MLAGVRVVVFDVELLVDEVVVEVLVVVVGGLFGGTDGDGGVCDVVSEWVEAAPEEMVGELVLLLVIIVVGLGVAVLELL